jgi:hypothetical protein
MGRILGAEQFHDQRRGLGKNNTAAATASTFLMRWRSSPSLIARAAVEAGINFYSRKFAFISGEKADPCLIAAIKFRMSAFGLKLFCLQSFAFFGLRFYP